MLDKHQEEIIKTRANKNLSQLNICSIDDLNLSDLELIFSLAEKFKKIGNKKYSLLKDCTIFNAFFESSTRTHSSFELAGKKLGADVINISGNTLEKKKESLLDISQTLNALRPEIIVIRTSKSGVPYVLAKHVQAAVINAGDGFHEHPTQALLDFFTIKEYFGADFQKKTILIVGDIINSRVFGSLVRLAQKYQMKIKIAAPETLLPKDLTKVFQVEVFYDIEKALQNTDIVYTLRVQEERGTGSLIPTLREFSKTFGISEKRFSVTNKNSILMHPGPIMRDIEVHNALIPQKNTLYFKQVENGLAIRSALLWLLGKRSDLIKKEFQYI